MPSMTFVNLPTEKKERIYKAIYLELARVPFPEMSINQVVKIAGIPRGSFYQYFKNKDDAFDFFIMESSKIIKEAVVERISTVHGDIFELCETVFDEIVVASLDEKWTALVNNVIPYVKFNEIEPLSDYIENIEKEKRILTCISLGIGNPDITDEQEIMDLIGIIEAIFQSVLPPIFSGKEPKDIIKEKFIRRLNIVKKAVLKGDV